MEEVLKDEFFKLRASMRAVSILCQSEELFYKSVKDEVLLSNDPDVRRFVNALSYRNPSSSGIIAALGEMLISSALIVSGVLLLYPLLSGINERSAILQFFYNLIYVASTQRAEILTLSIVVVSFVLFLSAVFIVRHASWIIRSER